MFDKLIESDSVGANFNPRRRFFLVSGVIVGALFLTAVLADLYAQELNLGIGDLEATVLLSPITNERPKVEEQQAPAGQKQDKVAADHVPERQVAMLRTDESPKAPTSISVTQNTLKARPYGDYKFSHRDVDFGTGQATGQTPGFGSGGGTSAGPSSASQSNAEIARVVDTPPVLPKAPAKKQENISLGVINGRATFLPKVAYPAQAIAMNVNGVVSVQVTIDETGKVIASKAVSGHPFLKGAAEKAAWNAKFSPTMLSKVPVKVTGVIVFNFIRN